MSPIKHGSHSESRRFLSGPGISLRFALLVTLAFLAPALRASDRVEWKPYDNAFLRIDEHPPADWNLYQVGKKDDRLLLQLGARFLLILVKDHQVYELDPKKLDRKGDAILWHESDRPDKSLASSLWTFRDIGLAWHIEFHLDTEGRSFSIEIPHPVDVRTIY